MNERDTDYFREHKILVNPDEFLLDNIKGFHFEEMSPDHKWIGLEMENGTMGHLNIFLKGKKINVRYEEWDDD